MIRINILNLVVIPALVCFPAFIFVFMRVLFPIWPKDRKIYGTITFYIFLVFLSLVTLNFFTYKKVSKNLTVVECSLTGVTFSDFNGRRKFVPTKNINKFFYLKFGTDVSIEYRYDGGILFPVKQYFLTIPLPQGN